jgi:exodeoxyribonuclease V alpha subunit
MAYDTKQVFVLTFTLKEIRRKLPDDTLLVNVHPVETEGYVGQKIPHTQTAIGIFHNPYEGDKYRCQCRFIESGKYGYYLNFIGLPEMLIPSTTDEMIRFISHNVKGIGDGIAADIIKTVGMDVISKVAENPDVLDDVKGVSKARKETFATWCRQSRDFEKLLIFVQTLRLPAKLAVSIYERFGSSSLMKIQKNPYYIYHTGDISFSRADELAFNNSSCKWTDPRRLICAVMAFVEQSISAGNICIPISEIQNGLNNYLRRNGKFPPEAVGAEKRLAETGFTEKEILDAIETLNRRKMLCCVEADGKTFVYTKDNLNTERSCALLISDRVRRVVRFPASREDVYQFISNSKYDLSKEQEDAVWMALNNPLSILTGGPGTGKTYVMRALLDTIRQFNPSAKVEMMAPTGKAGSRIRELTGAPARTIHSALRITPQKGSSDENKDFMLDADYVIVDEVSMMDEHLLYLFLKRTSGTPNVLFVGDSNQLPSVGAGNVLSELLQLPQVPREELTRIFRQKGGSAIVTNAAKLCSGKKITSRELIYNLPKGDFWFYEAESESAAADIIIQLVTKMHQRGDLPESYLVLSPVHGSADGTDELNRQIQDVVNPAVKDAKVFRVGSSYEIRVGDRVINTKNNEELNVHNGDLGTVTGIYTAEKETEISVLMDNEEEETIFSGKDVLNLALAYCLTVHKAQGSEAETVIMSFSRSHQGMLSSRLIYTAVTRARKNFIGVGSMEAMLIGAAQKEKQTRYSLLSRYCTDQFNGKGDAQTVETKAPVASAYAEENE